MFSRMFCITGTFLLSLLAAGCSSQEVSAPSASPTPQPAPGRIEYPASEIRDLSEEFGLAYPDPLSVDYPDAYTLPGIAAYRGEQLYYVSTQASGWVGQEPTRKSRRSCGKHCVRSTPKPGKKPKSAMSLLTATPLNKIF